MTKRIKFLIPIIFTFCLIVTFYFKRFVVIKFYPPIMNSFIFLVFFTSLFTKETVIQKFVRMLEGSLKPKIAQYTRTLTYIWCIILFINLLVSILTGFMSDKVWILYNGFLSYCLIALTFVIEYPIRLLYRRKYNL